MIAAIEFTLLKVVSESVYPGVTSYPAGGSFDKEKVLLGLNDELVPDANEARDSDELPPSVLWWDAHAGQGMGGGVEMNHIKRGLEALNGSLVDPELKKVTFQYAEDLLLIFSHIAK